jgi:alkylation response protein AidB-like acyl-CoA dehydrogenase
VHSVDWARNASHETNHERNAAVTRPTTRIFGDLVHRPELTDDEADAVDAFQEVIDDELAPLAQRNDAVGRFPTDSVKVLKRSGILASSVPVELGGPGRTNVFLLEIKTRIAMVDPALGQLFKTHDELVREILIYAPSERRDRLARQLLEDQVFLGLAVAESGRRVDDPLTTLASRDGDRWVVNGSKIYTTGAAEADYIALWAFDPTAATVDNPLRGFVQFLVPSTHPGVSVQRDWDTLGQRATDSGTIVFDGVELDESDRSNAPGFGPLPWPSTLYQLGFAAILCGVGFGALRCAAEFVVGTSRPWPSASVDNAGDDPYVRRLIGELAADLAAAYALTMSCAASMDALVDPAKWFPRSPYAVPIYAAKATASRAAVRATNEIFALAGTRSVVSAVGWDRFWRDARTISLHDPVDWKHAEIGNHLLTGWDPEPGVYQ